MTPDPKLEASRLINDYAVKKLALAQATAATRTELAALQAALNKASAPWEKELDEIEAAALALALEHGAVIFGERSSITENGWRLMRSLPDATDCDEKAAIASLQRTLKAATTEEEQMACNACLSVEVKLNKQYILSQYEQHEAWFDQHGITVVTKESVSLNPAPKPRAKKAEKGKAETGNAES